MMLRSSFRVLLVLLMLLPVARGQDVAEIRGVPGRGVDRESAVLDALCEAVSRANGIQVQAGMSSEARTARFLAEVRGNLEQEKVAVRGQSRSMEESVQTSFHGYVRSYEVLEERESDTGEHLVVVDAKVEVFDPKAPRASVRKTLSVLPIRLRPGIQDQEGISAALFAEQVAGDLTRILIQSRRFQVLERELLEQVREEQALVKSGEFDRGEARLLGGLLGADYLVQPTLQVFEAGSQEREIRATGERFVDRRVAIRLDFRVLDTREGETVLMDSVGFDLSPERIKEEFGRKAALADVVSALIGAAGRETGTRILDHVFPVKVVKVGEGAVVFLNQGGSRLLVGQKLRILRSGEELIDPDTGLSLGSEETAVGVLEVVEVLPKYSKARLVDGNPSDLQRGDICRPFGAGEGDLD
jgi:hypothetical protein